SCKTATPAGCVPSRGSWQDGSGLHDTCATPRRGVKLLHQLKQGEEFGAMVQTCPQATQVRGVLLTINMGNATCLKHCDQIRQRDLAGIGLPGKHGLAKREPAQTHAVEPANQPATAPDLQAMHLPLLVPLLVYLKDLRRNPGLFTPGN